MTTNPSPTPSVRLDDLIAAIKKVHPDPDGLAAKAIVDQGVSLAAVAEAATAALPPAADEVPELVPYGPDAKKVLELTFREALRLGHNYIGTEHILLALLEHENGDGGLSGLSISLGIGIGIGIGKEKTEQYVAKVLALILEQRNEPPTAD